MKKLLACLSLTLLCTSIARPQSNSTELNDLNAIIKSNSYPVQMDASGINDRGATILLEEAKQADFFMLGENHGVKQIAEFSRLMYNELSKEQVRLMVTEIGPATAAETEMLIRERKGAFEAFLKEGANLMSVPFFFLEQEVPILYDVIENFPNTGNSVWGLDQEFIAGAPIVLKHLEKLAITQQEKDVIKKAYREDFFNPFMIGEGEGDILKEMKQVFVNSSSAEAKRITDQLVQSHEIYKANSDGRGRWSNETRETLMMTNFEWYVANYAGTLPPLFFRFGGYHLHRGSSPTVQEALGLRIDEWAKKHQLTTTNIFVDAFDGNTLNPLLGTETELPTVKLWANSVFKNHIEGNQATLFDLRAIKGHPATKEMSKKERHLINGYDYLLLFSKGDAQNYLPGSLVTFAYGIPILICGLIVLVGLIYLVVRFIKRKKSRSKAS